MKCVSWNFFNFINYVKDSTVPKESLHPCDILPPVSAACIFIVIISEIR